MNGSPSVAQKCVTNNCDSPKAIGNSLALGLSQLYVLDFSRKPLPQGAVCKARSRLSPGSSCAIYPHPACTGRLAAQPPQVRANRLHAPRGASRLSGARHKPTGAARWRPKPRPQHRAGGWWLASTQTRQNARCADAPCCAAGVVPRVDLWPLPHCPSRWPLPCKSRMNAIH